LIGEIAMVRRAQLNKHLNNPIINSESILLTKWLWGWCNCRALSTCWPTSTS
jgi:hypothetical protein